MSAKTVDEIAEEQWEETVKTLQRFYTVIIAIALTYSLQKFIPSLEASESISSSVSLIALAIAFLSTIVPFYHGMERHLYVTHILKPDLGAGGRTIPLIVDVFAFIFEGGILFAMGRHLDEPASFIKLWTALLVVDIFWTLIVWRVQRSKRPIWAFNNFCWLSAAWLCWLILPCLLTTAGTEPLPPQQFPVIVVLIALIEIGRSIIDYKANWSFYFPDAHRRE